MGYTSAEQRRMGQREHYSKNRAVYKARAVERRRRVRAWFVEYKSSLSCARCGENHPACIDFHHRDPAQKIRDVAEMASCSYSKEKILAEVAKCDILCSNCHRKLHWDEQTG